ncbi:general transcription factor 3C polypeptide 5-like isoform 3-T3 [Ciconia maguari]
MLRDLQIRAREGYNNPQVSGENLIGLSRARRPHNAIFVNFDDEEIPAKPLDAAVQTWKKVCTNPVDKKVEEELGKLFEVRPVSFRNVVKANISVHPDKLKLLLPYLAYYMASLYICPRACRRLRGGRAREHQVGVPGSLHLVLDMRSWTLGQRVPML